MPNFPELERHSGAEIELTAALLRQEHALVRVDRERIATELHDQVIGRLFAAGLNLQGVASLLGPGPLAARLQTTVDDLDDTIEQIRTTVFHLRDESRVSDAGVIGRLMDVLEMLSPALGFAPGLRFSGIGPTLPPGIEADLLAVLSEALTNVAWHARASCADVDVTGSPDRLVIQITDDGVGVDRAPARSGMATMRRCAADHNGALSVEPWKPSGTRVTWTVPLRQRAGRQPVR